jgi:hypothetical protein
MLLATGSAWADEPTIAWRAKPFLELAKSSTNCGIQLHEPVNMAFDGKVLHTTAWSWQTYDFILDGPLAADGSGQVNAVSMPHQRSMVLQFAAGHGPRPIGFWRRYNTRCFWTFVPAEE